MVACDFAVVVTLHFQILYVFLVMEVSSRRLVHVNVTAHPTSLWTTQQLGEAILSDHAYRWLIHNRSGIFSEDMDRTIKNLGIEALKAPGNCGLASGDVARRSSQCAPALLY